MVIQLGLIPNWYIDPSFDRSFDCWYNLKNRWLIPYICQLSFPICGYQRIVAVPEIDEGKKVHGLAMFSPKFCGL